MQITYPSLYFAIDDFENAFADCAVRDGECVCVELVARDRYRQRESAIFLGSIRYEVLKQVSIAVRTTFLCTRLRCRYTTRRRPRRRRHGSGRSG